MLFFMIVGDGPQMEEIKSMANKSSYNERIIITGAIEHDELIKSGIYGACEIFATASETENQPMTILESQINGCICVGSDARGVPGMVTQGKSGIIVNRGDYRAMGDAFNLILSDREKIQTMRRETLNEVRRHFLPNVVEQWENEYQSLLINFKGRKFRDRLFFPLKKQENSVPLRSDK